jgi:hypothetical protein
MKENNFQEKNDDSVSKLYDYVKKFSFPRLAGTTGEKKAVKLTIQSFEDLGFTKDQIITQTFNFSTFYSEELVKIIGLMNLFIILILLLVKYLYPFFVIITVCIIAIVFFSMLKVLRHPEYRGFWEKHFGSLISATNIFVKIPARNIPANNSANLIISAHLDSKSQTFKTKWRVIFISIWEIGITLFLILITSFLIDLYLNIFKSIWLVLEISTIITSILTIFSIFMVFFIKTGNKSLGSLDNASGMALIFELSSIFKNNPLNHYNIWFCQFSAEEIGTMGSRIFVDTYKEEFLNNKLYQINFDMVSCKSNENRVEYIKSYGILPRKRSSPLLLSKISKIAEEEHIKIKGHTLLSGAHTDSVPFHLLKLETIDFSTLGATKYSHTKQDQPNKVNSHELLETLIIVKNLILRLDKNYSL